MASALSVDLRAGVVAAVEEGASRRQAAILVAGVTHTPAPAARAAARRRLKDAALWFDGRPAQVAALIDDIAAMEPPNRDRRKAALTSAWADLLADYLERVP